MLRRKVERKFFPGRRIAVSECSGITSGYSGRVATDAERHAHMRLLETTDAYNLSLIRDGWIVCVYDTVRGKPLQHPITDCMVASRLTVM